MPKEWKKKLLESPPTPTAETERALDPHELALMGAEVGTPPEIDLHGLSVDEAIHTLESFLHHEAVQGTDAVRIIHGKGEGKLKTAIEQWLTTQHLLVPKFQPARQRPGEVGAVLYAALEDLRAPRR